ncbi:helix-turn-helix domain-containing protein [Nonomuraea sp. NPDC004702]
MVKTPDWPADRFKALIDRILDETGLNKAQLAALVGINPSQVSRWYSGATRPRFETLTGLGAALRDRHPQLRLGPADLTAAAGYSTEDAIPFPAPPQVEAPALPSHLADIEDPTPKEAAMLRYLASMQEEIRQLNKKVDALTAERDRDDLENGASQQKGA